MDFDEVFSENDTYPELIRKLNNLRRSMQNASTVKTGPGLAAIRNAGGTFIFLTDQPPASGAVPGGGGQPGIINDTKELAKAQGQRDTDTWERGGEQPRSVKVWAITDIKYDEATLKLTFRMRPMLFDTKGGLHSIGPEDENETLVFTAVLCQENP